MGHKRKKYSIKFDVAKNIPSLYHKLPDQDFDIEKKSSLQMDKRTTRILEYIMNILKQAKYVVYNPDTGQWKGIDYEN